MGWDGIGMIITGLRSSESPVTANNQYKTTNLIAINAGQQRGLQLDPRLGRRGPHRGVHQQWRSAGFHLDLDDVGQGGRDGGDRDGDRGVLLIKVCLLNEYKMLEKSAPLVL